MCEACSIIKERKHIIYEDEKTVAVMSPKPVAKGHIIVFSREHYPSMDEIPISLISHFYYVASFAASVLFEASGPDQNTGTNIIVQDGKQNSYGHFAVHVIPRKEGDGINYRWEPKQGKPEKLEEDLKRLKEETFYIGKDVEVKENPPAPDKRPKQEEKIEADAQEGEENYLIKQLERIP